MMTVYNLNLLNALQSLSPNHVYFLAPKATVLRGYDYYVHERLEGFTWDRTQTILTCTVRGTTRYAVRIIDGKDGLNYSCTCPAWTSDFQCKHVICSLLTAVNLLVPDRFRMGGDATPRRKLLEGQLLALSHQPAMHPAQALQPPRFEVTLVDQDGNAEVVITNHGVVCRSITGMPTELALLYRSIQDQAWSVEAGLRDFLNHHGDQFPLFFESDQGRMSLEWTPSAHYATKTELNIVGATVVIAARCVRFGEVLDQVRIVMGFVVDMKTQKLSFLEYDGGWGIYDHLYANSLKEGLLTQNELLSRPLSLPDQDWTRIPQPFGTTGWNFHRAPFSIPVQQFLRLQLDCPRSERTRIFWGVQLKVNGKEVPLSDVPVMNEGSPYQYRLTVIPLQKSSGKPLLQDDGAMIRADCWLGESHTSPSRPLFTMFPCLNRSPAVSGGLKTQKRRRLLYDTFFQLWKLQKTGEARKIVKACLACDEFRPAKLKAEADSLLQRFSEPALTPSVRLAIQDGRWCFVPNDWARESLLYALPYQVFGPDIFENMHTHEAMELPASQLYPRLSELFVLAQEAGIALFFQDNPLLFSKWEYSIEVRRSSSIDWFELHPEIVCDGVPISPQELDKILQQGGIIEAGGALRMIDQNTRVILQALASLSGRTGRKSGAWEPRAVVQVPKLQILDWVALRRRGVPVRLPPADEVLIGRLLQFERIEPVALPKRLQAALRHYQEEGYQWLAFLYQHRLGACLADDMGLGKTLQAITLLAGIKEGLVTPPEPIHGPHLIVLPPSLLFNWEGEIKRFYPDLMVKAYTGKERSTAFSEADVVLTTYGLVRRDIARLETIRFNVIVFDEAQAVKNILARTTGAARRLKGYFKCVMTGTPLENHVGEYYSLMDLCVPGLLGDYEELKGKLKAPPPQVLETIMQRTRPFILRRTKGQILKELPPKIETDLYLELTDRQKTLYQQTVTEIRNTIANAYQTKTAAQARVIALTAILKLRQICLSPGLMRPNSPDHSPKVLFLLDRLHELIEEQHSALVFSQFTSFLDVVEEELRRQAVPYVRLDGSTPTPMRKKLVRQFQEGEKPSVFLLSLKAGGQGLNLTKASYVFHLDPWWNPAVENQASDRAHRIGQHQKVSIMRLLMRHTIEEKMMELKRQKLELYHAVLDGVAHGGGGRALTQKDFEFLLN